jgi:hypothetical protein
MRIVRASILSVLAVSVGVACGSSSTTGPADGGFESGEMPLDASSDQVSGDAEGGTGAPDAGTTNDAGDASDATDAGVSDGFGSGSPCPASVPAADAACSPVGLACEYGDALEFACDTVSTCAAAGWQVQSAATCSGSQPDGGTCPATIADVPNGAACTPKGLNCEYPTGLCDCIMDHTGAPLIWTCFPQSGCPYPRPRLGDVCTTDGQQCDYGGCGLSIACSQGTWHVGYGGCHP